MRTSGEPSALERAVEVMDTLRSPGGCPWDAEQTHESLARYLIEETYETLEAIETNDPVLLREELGDLLLQVLFHARLAEELPELQRFSVEDVAGDLVAKLVRRHPHVFGSGDGSDGDGSGAGGDGSSGAMLAGTRPTDAEQVNAAWEQNKALEKGRTSVVEGVPVAQPALALTAKLIARAARAGIAADPTPAEVAVSDAEAAIGARLFAVVQDAVAAGVEPETALRRATRSYRAALLVAEHARRA